MCGMLALHLLHIAHNTDIKHKLIDTITEGQQASLDCKACSAHRCTRSKEETCHTVIKAQRQSAYLICNICAINSFPICIVISIWAGFATVCDFLLAFAP